jgi:hypothetical protein
MPGRTTKPLKILVDSDLLGQQTIQELIEKGHEVYELDPVLHGPKRPDLILGPTCWRMTPELLKYLGSAVKAARDRKYGASKP